MNATKHWKLVAIIGGTMIACVAVLAGTGTLNFPWWYGNQELMTTYKDVNVTNVVWGMVGNGPGKIFTVPYTEGDPPVPADMNEWCITVTATLTYPAGTPLPASRSTRLYSIDCNGFEIDSADVELNAVGPIGETSTNVQLVTKVVPVRVKTWSGIHGNKTYLYVPEGAKLDFVPPALRKGA